MAIDTFYTIKALHEQAVKIHLHYFCSQQGHHPTELNQYCETIHTYPQTEQGAVPAALMDAIKKDNHPLLLQSITCLQQLKEITATGKTVIVRVHKYASFQLDNKAGNFISKLFGSRPKNEDPGQLPHNCQYAFANKEDADNFRQANPLLPASYLPLFTAIRSVTSEPGMGSFCLYHGDLSDPSNKEVAAWLISKVFNDINTPLVIAGKEPGRKIEKLAALFSHICLVSNPSAMEMDELVRKAHINILPSFGTCKPELKLMHALATGRHCVTNEEAVAGTTLKDACHTGKNAAALKSIVLQLYRRPFEENEIELRKRLFVPITKERPVNTLLQWLYS